MGPTPSSSLGKPDNETYVLCILLIMAYSEVAQSCINIYTPSYKYDITGTSCVLILLVLSRLRKKDSKSPL